MGWIFSEQGLEQVEYSRGKEVLQTNISTNVFFIRHPAKTFNCRISFLVRVRFTRVFVVIDRAFKRPTLTVSKARNENYEQYVIHTTNTCTQCLCKFSSFCLPAHLSQALFRNQPPLLGNSSSSIPCEDTGGNDNIAVHLGFGQ